MVCGLCGTELPPNAKPYNESAVPELPGRVDRLVADWQAIKIQRALRDEQR